MIFGPIGVYKALAVLVQYGEIAWYDDEKTLRFRGLFAALTASTVNAAADYETGHFRTRLGGQDVNCRSRHVDTSRDRSLRKSRNIGRRRYRLAWCRREQNTSRHQKMFHRYPFQKQGDNFIITSGGAILGVSAPRPFDESLS